MALDDVVILNVDTNTLETPFDDLQSLPYDVVCDLRIHTLKCKHLFIYIYIYFSVWSSIFGDFTAQIYFLIVIYYQW